MMKPKIYFFKNTILVVLLSGVSLFTASAASDYKQAAKDLAQGSPVQSPEEIVAVLEQFVRWFYLIFFILAVYFLLVAAFNYLTAGGDPEKIKKAHGSLLWSFVAIVVALISVGAAQIIYTFITPPRASTTTPSPIGENGSPSRPSMDPTSNPINGQYGP